MRVANISSTIKYQHSDLYLSLFLNSDSNNCTVISVNCVEIFEGSALKVGGRGACNCKNLDFLHSLWSTGIVCAFPFYSINFGPELKSGRLFVQILNFKRFGAILEKLFSEPNFEGPGKIEPVVEKF